MTYLLNYTHHIPKKNFDQSKCIIFLHGFMFSDSWTRLGIVNFFSKYQYVLIDSLGFGSSPKPHDIDYTIEDHTKYLYYTIKHIIYNIIKKNNIILYGIGYSIGAVLLVNLMVRYKLPWCKCVIISPAFFINNAALNKETQTMFRLSITKGFEDFFNISRLIIDVVGDNINILGMNGLDKTYMNEFKRNDPISAKKTFFNLLFCPDWDIYDVFNKIYTKILCIHPTNDEYIPFKVINDLYFKYIHILDVIAWKNSHFIDQNSSEFISKLILQYIS